jgi:hypothetical protein
MLEATLMHGLSHLPNDPEGSALSDAPFDAHTTLCRSTMSVITSLLASRETGSIPLNLPIHLPRR